jgi:hypothetical protein
MNPRFYSLTEVAGILHFPNPEVGGRGYQRVLGAVRRGEIRARRIGREYRVSASEIDRLADEAVAS